MYDIISKRIKDIFPQTMLVVGYEDFTNTIMKFGMWKTCTQSRHSPTNGCDLNPAGLKEQCC